MNKPSEIANIAATDIAQRFSWLEKQSRFIRPSPEEFQAQIASIIDEAIAKDRERGPWVCPTCRCSSVGERCNRCDRVVPPNQRLLIEVEYARERDNVNRLRDLLEDLIDETADHFGPLDAAGKVIQEADAFLAETDPDSPADPEEPTASSLEPTAQC